MPATEAELRRVLEDAGLGSSVESLLALALPAIEIAVIGLHNEDPQEVVSKLCGRPDVPGGFKWPEVDGSPLDFIGQFRLDELPALATQNGLPASGLLSVFFMYDSWGWTPTPALTRCFIFSEEQRLERVHEVPRPRDWAHGEPGAPAILEFGETLTLPPGDHPVWEGINGEAVEAVVVAMEELLPVDGAVPADVIQDVDRTAHRFFGHPKSIQDDPRSEIQREGVDEPGDGISLLLQLDSWYGHVWGDMGCLYVLGEDEEIRGGRVDGCVGLIAGY